MKRLNDLIRKIQIKPTEEEILTLAAVYYEAILKEKMNATAEMDAQTIYLMFIMYNAGKLTGSGQLKESDFASIAKTFKAMRGNIVKFPTIINKTLS